ncbi:uncharacterized protein LOC127251735 [Andrographis paniculata]|uniref:uncharacterized protein LOC127251735 n=1 Tax=Andrographis paniculata TaxID=175694 RepID=UPI0021E8E5F5|nr:uncharacterized protein LOC127251735 [Andrographis paniculata]
MSREVVELVAANSSGSAEEADRLRRQAVPPPDPPPISGECLSVAEEAAEHVLNWVHPTLDSEEKRTIVVDYVQQLVNTRLNCEVVCYGSVPLKTYLPDGDIDLTVIKGGRSVESLAHDVLALLQDKEHNENAEYEVKDTQFIDAEVKIVKCLVRGTVMDISFNQLGGLSTLCFLEQVDRLVGRSHLFKRSIILIKTWCYYESRILGSHHGLISTYALEILILYIFQNFHSSMNGPLEVLFRFLDYYSGFDWENYCISLKGPVCKSSLPDIVVRMPESRGEDMLISEEFLEKSLEMYSVSSRGDDTSSKTFQIKHLNIIDPLKDYNNLGRSVNRGNFYRIQSALKYGARKLRQILMQPKDKVADEIYNFFANTRARHGEQYQSRLQLFGFDFDDDDSFTASLSSPDGLSSEYDLPLKSSDSDLDNNGKLEAWNGYETELSPEGCGSTDSLFISGQSTNGDKDSFETSNSTLRNGQSGSTSSERYTTYLSENLCHKLQHFDMNSSAEKFGLKSWLEDRGKHAEMNAANHCFTDNPEVVCLMHSGSALKAGILESSSPTILGGELEAIDPLADLTGDYDCHIRSLLRGHFCYRFSSSTSLVDGTQNKKTKQDSLSESNLGRQNTLPAMNVHKISTDHIVHPGVTSALFGTAFQFEGKTKARGTGTYFPQMSVYCVEKPSFGRLARNDGSGNHNHLHKYENKNGTYPARGDPDAFEYHNYESKYQGQRKSSTWKQPTRLVGDRKPINVYPGASCKIEFGSVGNLAEDMLDGSGYVKGASPLGSSPRTQRRARMEIVRPRAADGTLHLKNQDEFPPLCQ